MALSVAEYFDIPNSKTVSYADKVKYIVEEEWREIASKYKLCRSAISVMELAFENTEVRKLAKQLYKSYLDHILYKF